MIYVPPTLTDIGDGRLFDAAPVEDGFLELRRILNGTVGCYQRSSGHNVPNNRQAIGAASVRPAATVEVFDTNIEVTGPQTYTPSVPLAFASTPWDRYSTQFYPAGASVSFCAPSDGVVFVSYEVCLNKSHSAYVASQPAYSHHTIECRGVALYRVSGGATTPEVPGSKSQRRIGMEGGTKDFAQAGSLAGNGSFSVTKGSFYAVWVRLDMILDMFGAAMTDRATYMQMMSPGATITAALIKV